MPTWSLTRQRRLTVRSDVRCHVQVLEGQVTWFVYMIGAIIKGRLTTGSTDAQELVDGDLATRALSLLDAADTAFHMRRCAVSLRQQEQCKVAHARMWCTAVPASRSAC
jgi:hypothetical protein